jgi:small subunit ribosomal protein S18
LDLLNKSTAKPVRKKRRGYIPKRKVCHFCAEKIEAIDYKDVPRLWQFLSDTWKIEKGRKYGTCAKHQRSLARAIKRARHLALLPFSVSHADENETKQK